MSTETVKISAKNVNVYYGAKQAIDNVSIDIATEHVTALLAHLAAANQHFCGR